MADGKRREGETDFADMQPTQSPRGPTHLRNGAELFLGVNNFFFKVPQTLG